jgi:23S rRNA (cytosine1962-C5)-methyltransferase
MLDLWLDFRDSAILYEDEHLIAVDKPAGVPSQAAEVEHDDDVVARLKRYLGARRGVAAESVYLGVHQRLDRDTSGVMMFALSREANPGLARQFEGREVEKTYVAAVQGLAHLHGERVLRDRLARGTDGRMQVVRRGDVRGREAVTRVRVTELRQERALVTLGCDTGRTHQLRVQLAHAGAPIAGDRWYGGPPALRLLLHARELRLAHPVTGEMLALQAQLPLEIGHWLEHGPSNALSDPELLKRALLLAIEARYRLGRAREKESPTTAFRLLHGAAEGVPGLAVDVYGEHLVAHFAQDAGEAAERAVLDALEALGPAGVYVKRHARQKNELGEARGSEWAPALPLRGTAAA